MTQVHDKVTEIRAKQYPKPSQLSMFGDNMAGSNETVSKLKPTDNEKILRLILLKLDKLDYDLSELMEQYKQ
jgi:hypothetical protein